VNLLPARYFGRATGQHRKPQPAWGAVVGQAIQPCEPCGIHTVHDIRRDGSTACTENHAVTEGDPA
jgi:hypothetical protein